MISREEAIVMAKEAGITVYEGAQDRAVFDGSIIDALLSLARLAHNRGLEDGKNIALSITKNAEESGRIYAAFRELKQ